MVVVQIILAIILMCIGSFNIVISNIFWGPDYTVWYDESDEENKRVDKIHYLWFMMFNVMVIVASLAILISIFGITNTDVAV